MRTNFERILEFHERFEIPARSEAGFPPQDRIDLRVELIREEFEELKDAIAAQDLVEVADALTDLLYVTYGAALEFGIDADVTFREVHRSNMTKLGEDGRP